ncbi:hypothetical protein B0H12DRAFT_1099700 [Mycena haematopus]|nr:hypothetical protein B0H12DRAFT_1099700 [Mycena haematopus]
MFYSCYNPCRSSSSSSLTKMKASAPPSPHPVVTEHEKARPTEGPVEEMIVTGTAFGFRLFNLVFRLLALHKKFSDSRPSLILLFVSFRFLFCFCFCSLLVVPCGTGFFAASKVTHSNMI